MKKEKKASKDELEKKQQTKTLAQLPATTNTIERYLAEIGNHPILSREEQHKLATKQKEDGDLEAAKQLIRANLKFVVKIANEYNRSIVDEKLTELDVEG